MGTRSERIVKEVVELEPGPSAEQHLLVNPCNDPETSRPSYHSGDINDETHLYHECPSHTQRQPWFPQTQKKTPRARIAGLESFSDAYQQ